MVNDVDEELKKLSPEARIARLKEIQKKREEEIRKAQEMIKKSEAEIEEETKSKRQIPIPQLRSIDVSTLFGKGTQEGDMMDTKQFKTTRKRKEEPEEEAIESKVTPEEEEALEAKIKSERAMLQEQQEQAALYQAGIPKQERRYQANLAKDLAEGTASDIYSMVKSAYNEAKETGYVSSEQMERINVATQAALTKMDAMVSGDYEASKQATNALVASARIAKAMKDKYQA